MRFRRRRRSFRPRGRRVFTRRFSRSRRRRRGGALRIGYRM